MAVISWFAAVSFGQLGPGPVVFVGNSVVSESATSVSAVMQVSTGEGHVVALRRDGTVVAWGANSAGQCNVPPGLKSGLQISAGRFHTVVLKNDGSVMAWGLNTSGQCDVPATATSVIQVSAGGYHTLGLKADGSVVAWGANTDKQSDVPVGLKGVTQVSAGGNFSLALRANGTVVAWGRNTQGECNVPAQLTGVRQISAGYDHALALLNDGTVVGWGSDGLGQAKVPVGLDHGATVSAGLFASIVTKQDGSIVAWGFNGSGQTSPPMIQGPVVQGAVGLFQGVALRRDGTVVTWGELTSPEGLGGVTQISEGPAHSLFLRSDGTVLAIGKNHSGQCNVPVGLSGVIQVAAGADHSVALKADGTVVSWGKFVPGRLSTPDRLTNVVQVAAGIDYTLVLKRDGTIATWGYGPQLPAVGSIVQVSAGGYHALALKSDGTVIAWGSNGSGQSSVPVGLTGVVQVSANLDHSVALRADGTVVGWGENGNSQTVVPAGLSGISEVSAGYYHTLALKSGGSVVAWGRAYEGQSAFPAGLFGLAHVSAGLYGSLGLKRVYLIAGQSQIAQNGNGTAAIYLPVSSAADTDVAIESDSLLVKVPPLVRIPAGSHSASFAISGSGGYLGTAMVKAKLKGSESLAAVKFGSGGFSELSVSPNPIPAGHTAIGRVAIDALAPAGGFKVELSSDHAAAIPVSSVVIPEGRSFTTFSVSTSVVATHVNVTITAKSRSGFTTTSVKLNGPIPISLTVSPSAVRYGDSVSGSVTLDAPAPSAGIAVPLRSDKAAAVVPATVQVLSGQRTATFPITTNPVSSPTSVRISAVLNGIGKWAPLTVSSAIPVIDKFTISPLVVRGDDQAVGTLTLNFAAPLGGVLVSLARDRGGAQGPTSLLIPAGVISATFPIDTVPVASTTTSTFEAKTSFSRKIATVTVLAPDVALLGLNPNRVKYGAVAKGLVMLDSPAAHGGALVQITSSDPVASVPATVLVPEGSYFATFEIKTKGAGGTVRVGILAKITTVKSVVLTVGG